MPVDNGFTDNQDEIQSLSYHHSQQHSHQSSSAQDTGQSDSAVPARRDSSTSVESKASPTTVVTRTPGVCNNQSTTTLGTIPNNRISFSYPSKYQKDANNQAFNAMFRSDSDVKEVGSGPGATTTGERDIVSSQLLDHSTNTTTNSSPVEGDHSEFVSQGHDRQYSDQHFPVLNMSTSTLSSHLDSHTIDRHCQGRPNMGSRHQQHNREMLMMSYTSPSVSAFGTPAANNAQHHQHQRHGTTNSSETQLEPTTQKVVLNVSYPLKKQSLQVTFPSGISVAQAKDICMLRFNLWQQALIPHHHRSLGPTGTPNYGLKDSDVPQSAAGHEDENMSSKPYTDTLPSSPDSAKHHHQQHYYAQRHHQYLHNTSSETSLLLNHSHQTNNHPYNTKTRRGKTFTNDATSTSHAAPSTSTTLLGFHQQKGSGSGGSSGGFRLFSRKNHHSSSRSSSSKSSTKSKSRSNNFDIRSTGGNPTSPLAVMEEEDEDEAGSSIIGDTRDSVNNRHRGGTRSSNSVRKDVKSTKSVIETTLSLREKFALFWPSAGLWLEPSRSLHSYSIPQNEIIELQQANKFTPQHSNSQKNQYLDGYLHWLQSKEGSISTSWKLRWVVIKDCKLRAYKKKPSNSSSNASSSHNPDFVIDLAQSFKLVDQNGSCSTSESILFAPLMALSMMSAGNGMGDGGSNGVLFVIQCGGQTNIFRTLNESDFEPWQTILREIQLTFSSIHNSAKSLSDHRNSRSNSILSNSMSSLQINNSKDIGVSRTNEDGKGTTLSHLAIENRSLETINSFRSTHSISMTHAGYMHMRIPRKRGFSRRYFVLEGQRLSIYYDENADSAGPGGATSSHINNMDRKSISNVSMISGLTSSSANSNTTTKVRKLQASYNLTPKHHWVELCWLGSRYLFSIISSNPGDADGIGLADSQNTASLEASYINLPSSASVAATTTITTTATLGSASLTDNNKLISGGEEGVDPVISSEILRFLVDKPMRAGEWKSAFVHIAGLLVHDHSEATDYDGINEGDEDILIYTKEDEENIVDQGKALGIAEDGSTFPDNTADSFLSDSKEVEEERLLNKPQELRDNGQGYKTDNSTDISKAHTQILPLGASSTSTSQGGYSNVQGLPPDEHKLSTKECTSVGPHTSDTAEATTTQKESLPHNDESSEENDSDGDSSSISSREERLRRRRRENQMTMSEFINQQRIPGRSPPLDSDSSQFGRSNSTTKNSKRMGYHPMAQRATSSTMLKSSYNQMVRSEAMNASKSEKAPPLPPIEQRWVPINIDKYKQQEETSSGAGQKQYSNEDMPPYISNQTSFTGSGIDEGHHSAASPSSRKFLKSFKDTKLPWMKRRGSIHK